MLRLVLFALAGDQGHGHVDGQRYTILYSQSSPAPPALPPPPLLLLHLLLILHCSALHLTSARQQVAPDPAKGRLRPLGILCYMELREGDVAENRNIWSSRGVAE